MSAQERRKTATEANYDLVVAGLTGPTNVKKFEMALAGTGVTPARFLRQCQTAFLAVPKLAECNPYTVLGAMLGAAQMGLELEPALEECDIIPYAGEAKLMPRYGGLMKLVRQGEVTEMYAETVRDRDPFRIVKGTKNGIEHEVDYRLSEDERGEAIGYYAVAKLARGGVEFTYMHAKDVEKVRDVVKNKTPESRWGFSPWNTSFDRMAEKTVIRRLCKRLPKTDRAARAMQLQAMAEDGEPLSIHMADATVKDAVSPTRPATMSDVADDLEKKAAPKDAQGNPEQRTPTPPATRDQPQGGVSSGPQAASPASPPARPVEDPVLSQLDEPAALTDAQKLEIEAEFKRRDAAAKPQAKNGKRTLPGME